MAKNVILADYDVQDTWEFKKAIEEETCQPWDIQKCITNLYHGSKLKNLWRYVLYFGFSFRMFFMRGKYEKIIAWQQFFGLLLAFFCRVFHVKKAPKIYVMTFIFKSKSKFYYRFIRYIVTSKYITKLIVLSDEEKQYYANLFEINEDLFYCTRIGVPDIAEKFSQNAGNKKYYLSVGRSNRDYKFLRSAWKKEYGDLIIICDSYTEAEKDGITCLRKCYGDEYLRYVANCYAQIIPLEDPNISSGSLTFLQAMMLSKPSIVTDNVTVRDYIVSGDNGIIISKTNEALSEALKVLEDEEVYLNMSNRARITYKANYSEQALGKSIAQLIR